MSKRVLKTVMGAAVVTSLSAVANASENPFGIKDLDSGYLQVAEAGKEQKEMVCGEGKCGGQMMKSQEMNCGAMKKQSQEQEKKAMEGKCAGMKTDQAQPPSTETKPQ
ncbi:MULTISPECIES: HvfA family oxazolone/thioamide-modified RiPP metallophore [unclassified Methylocaldum]|jgi:uncharacterized low-complexity protein|uniref:HvfA family oxazolone/thioamide-modified RiPP metallophore n=1 Tax=unclassified Methylocaldum TaxID=2622260 RepID=UPI00098A5BDF|nr:MULTISPECIES: hypothetical protein [unclassified Methylocaldum]MBP1150452.1 putative low-complexity protein [Methylocaldum sp. RMAD-M]